MVNFKQQFFKEVGGEDAKYEIHVFAEEGGFCVVSMVVCFCFNVYKHRFLKKALTLSLINDGYFLLGDC